MNAANEAAVSLFLERKLSFTGIMQRVESVMNLHSIVEPTYGNILEADAWAREQAARS